MRLINAHTFIFLRHMTIQHFQTHVLLVRNQFCVKYTLHGNWYSLRNNSGTGQTMGHVHYCFKFCASEL